MAIIKSRPLWFMLCSATSFFVAYLLLPSSFDYTLRKIFNWSIFLFCVWSGVNIFFVGLGTYYHTHSWTGKQKNGKIPLLYKFIWFPYLGVLLPIYIHIYFRRYNYPSFEPSLGSSTNFFKKNQVSFYANND